mmetsp:Transcript_26504/g.61270  ORF Transcript_26504/g.61270 Transcript_26504/m.61270 type:complete len:326 (-) Transcript_26504:807-1784(-)
MTVRERVQTPHARNRNGRIPPHDASAVRLQQAAACAEPGGRSVGPGVLRGGLVQQAPECLPLVAAVLFLVLPRIVPLAVAAAPRVVLLPVVVLFPVVFLPIVVLLPVVLLPIVLVAPARRAAAAAAAPTGRAAAGPRELAELWRDVLPGLAHDLADEGRRLLLAPAGEERVGLALVLRAPGAPDPVDVVLRVLWAVVVDHDGDVPDVEPSRGHVRGAQNASLAAPEPVERGVALGLVEVAVDLLGPQAQGLVVVQLPSEVRAVLLGVAEDQAIAAVRQLSQDPLQGRHLVVVRVANLDPLRDVRVRRDVVGADLDLHGVVDVFLG